MTSLIGLIVIGFGILLLFYLDRDEIQTSYAIWIPWAWLLIGSSRPISSWLSSPVAQTSEYIDGSPLDRNVLTLLLLLGVVALSKRMKQTISIVKTNPAIVMFLVYCLVSVLWAEYPFVLLKRWIRTVGDIVMILVIVTEKNWAVALRRVLMRVGFLLIPLSILFIRFYPSLGRSYSAGGAPMWTGVGDDKNALGELCMIGGVVLLWRGLALFSNHKERHRKRKLIVVASVLAMAVYLLLVANSQTALSGFAMGSTIVALMSLCSVFRRPPVASLLVGGMVAIAFGVLFLGIGGQVLALLGRNSSLTGRTEVWQTVLPFAANPWVGAGYENFWIGERLLRIEKLVGSGLNQAHNGYIEVYLNIGLVGLILLGSIIVTGFRNIMRGLRTDPGMNTLRVTFLFLALIYNFTEASFKFMSPVWGLFLFASMALPKAKSTAVIPGISLKQEENPWVAAVERSGAVWNLQR